MARYDVRNGLTRLATQRISRASMVQRAGRAGRPEPGICWHLFAKEQAERAAEHAEPDILQSDLTGFWLELLQWGCHDPAQLTWLDAPPAAALAAARSLLHRLEATDDGDKLTTPGRQMAALGCEPRLAAMLVTGAALSADGRRRRRCWRHCWKSRARGQMDIGYWLSRPQPNWRQRAAQLAKRLPQRAGQIDVDLAPRLLAQAFTDRIAQRRGGTAATCWPTVWGGDEPDEALSRTPWLIVPSLLQGHNSPDARILLALPVDIEALAAQLPAIVTQRTAVEWDDEKGTLRARSANRSAV